jgi:molybdate transport repressor ModE-like protein
MPELRSLEALLVIARAGSLGQAGRELGVSQQTISARLATLERLIGVPLVVRTPRGSQLSRSGVVLAEWAEQLLVMAERVDAGIATLREESRAKVRVAASFTVAEQLMPRWMVSMRARAVQNGEAPPDVILDAMNSDRVLAAVRKDEVDVGFIESPSVPKDVRSTAVATDELVVAVPPSHKWARRSTPISAKELNSTPLVLREPGSGTRESLIAALRRSLGFSAELATPVLELSSVTSIRAAVLSGAGPTVLSRLSAADDLMLGRLHGVAVADVDLRRTIRAVWIGDRTPRSSGVRDLLSHIRRQRVVG